MDEWKLSFEITWDDPWYRWQATGTVIAYIVGISFYLYQLIPAGLNDGQLIFHYNPYFGIDQVHHWAWAIVLSILFLIIVIIDLISAAHLFRKDRIASRILLCTASVFVILVLITTFFMTSVNV